MANLTHEQSHIHPTGRRWPKPGPSRIRERLEEEVICADASIYCSVVNRNLLDTKTSDNAGNLSVAGQSGSGPAGLTGSGPAGGAGPGLAGPFGFANVGGPFGGGGCSDRLFGGAALGTTASHSFGPVNMAGSSGSALPSGGLPIEGPFGITGASQHTDGLNLHDFWALITNPILLNGCSATPSSV